MAIEGALYTGPSEKEPKFGQIAGPVMARLITCPPRSQIAETELGCPTAAVPGGGHFPVNSVYSAQVATMTNRSCASHRDSGFPKTSPSWEVVGPAPLRHMPSSGNRRAGQGREAAWAQTAIAPHQVRDLGRPPTHCKSLFPLLYEGNKEHTHLSYCGIKCEGRRHRKLALIQ